MLGITWLTAAAVGLVAWFAGRWIGSLVKTSDEMESRVLPYAAHVQAGLAVWVVLSYTIGGVPGEDGAIIAFGVAAVGSLGVARSSHSSGTQRTGLMAVLSRVTPVPIGVGMGAVQSAILAQPVWQTLGCGLLFPLLAMPLASHLQEIGEEARRRSPARARRT